MIQLFQDSKSAEAHVAEQAKSMGKPQRGIYNMVCIKGVYDMYGLDNLNRCINKNELLL